jgi:hydrogenase expression/formation protein HypE
MTIPGSSCPVPLGGGDTIQLGHGGGGRLTWELIDRVFHSAFGDPADDLHDGAVVDTPAGRLALSTDAYVVQPLFFPGGDIGSLAVNGTVNDVAMCGARPQWLTVAFVLEEGLPIDVVRRVVASMAEAAAAAEVRIIAGDTKVVDRGNADGMYVTTAGVGVVAAGVDVSPQRIRPGDALLLSGDIGRHGIAILAEREGLEFDTTVTSDCASVTHLISGLLQAGIDLHCARDLTRGGLSSALVELATTTGLDIDLDEPAVPLLEQVRGACEMLGLDPLYVACEGRFCAFVPQEQAVQAIEVLRLLPHGEGACCVGRVGSAGGSGRVHTRSALGVQRIVELFSGEQLPRIC